MKDGPGDASGAGGEGRAEEVSGAIISSGKGFKPGDDRSRVEAYQQRWQRPLDLLALVTIWLVVVPPGAITHDQALATAILVLRLALSGIYAVDILVRTRLAPRHWYYLRHNPLSVATVFFPFLRVALSLRLLRSIFQRGAIGRFVLAAGLMFLNLTLVVFLFERHAPGANIKTVGNALWWAVVTLATVGYGDYTPVTWQGRIAAMLLMVVGFAVLATLTAQIASAFIDQAARARAAELTPGPATGPASESGSPEDAAPAALAGLAAEAADPVEARLAVIQEQLDQLVTQVAKLAPPP